MEIEFVNHASIIFSHKEVQLMCDPWMEGEVFDNGWRHLAPTKFQYSDFERINYIWFSHEHPDHFFPPNIKKIEEKYRKNITVLYKKTNDRKVVEFLEKLNYKNVVELEEGKWFDLSDEVQLVCHSFSHDSWMAIKQGEHTILNTNDCLVNTKELAEDILKITGDVSILMTQFSYGQFEGNSDQPEKRRAAVAKKYRQIDNQLAVFKPKYFIPMASFVYFCHEENYYMNDSINKIGDVFDYYTAKNEVKPVVLYLEDKWTLSEEYQGSDKAIESWEVHYQNVVNKPNLLSSQNISLADLNKSANSYVEQFKAKPNLFKKLKKTAPLLVYVTDFNKVMELSFEGIKDSNSNEYDVKLSSEVLSYCMKFGWGFNTTHVNGRLYHSENGFENFLKYESLSNLLNHDEEIPSLSKRAINKLKRGIKGIFK